ncbi:MAG: hypothetical protein GYB65_05390, partial [Chloroflexi bacterium]|nr:hypothetical protein [Chloroflexota bacterium]
MRRARITALILVAFVLSSALPIVHPEAQLPFHTVDTAAAQGGLRTVTHDQTGKLTFVGVDRSQEFSGFEAAGYGPSPANALAAVSGFATEFGLSNPGSELSLMRTTQAAGTTYRFQQYYQGIPVLGGEMAVNYDPSGRLAALAGEISPDLDLSVTPTFPAALGPSNALAHVAKVENVDQSTLALTDFGLWIYDARLLRPSNEPVRLVWRYEVTSTTGAPIRYLVLVNAHTGAVSLSFNQVDYLWGELGEQVAAEYGPQAVARDLPATRPGAPNFPDPSIQTWDVNFQPLAPGAPGTTLVCSTRTTLATAGTSCDGTATVTPANAANFWTMDTFDYYDASYGRNSIDNLGMGLVNRVNYRDDPATPYLNAFWNGSMMTYGDADFFTVDDVIAHELTHGVTEFSSNLFYYYESGAINETMSDVFGELADQANGMDSYGAGESAPWAMGEDLPVLGAIRDMSDPTIFGDPDRTQSPNYFVPVDGGIWDNGGVHFNNGVGNKAAYLMAAGGSFNGYTITALGNVKTGAIWYETNFNLLTSGADWELLGAALNQACQNLIGGPEGITAADCTEVSEAVLATEMAIDPVYGEELTYDAEAVCPGDTPLTDLFFDGFEGGYGNFTVTAPVDPTLGAMPTGEMWGTPAYGPYAVTGDNAIWAASNPEVRFYPGGLYESNLTMNTPVSLTGGTTYWLHFDHAIDMEIVSYDPAVSDIAFDGVVLEYSTDGGGIWNDIQPLFDDGQDYNRVIFDLFGNPLGGRAGFASESHGYVSTRYDLTSLAGQDVQLRWRLGSDDTAHWLGYWIDNLRIYACNPPVEADMEALLYVDRIETPGGGTATFVRPNDTVVLGLMVNDAGPADATGVVADLTLPTGMSYVSDT